MKILHKVSVAFSVLDSVSKRPVKGAEIFCDGIKTRFIYKRSGLYIFTKISDGKHKFEIKAPDYQNRVFDVEILPGEINVSSEGVDQEAIKTDTDVVNCQMIRNSDYNLLSPFPYAVITKDGEAYKNKWVTIIQDTKIPYLRITKTISEGATEIPLNTDFNVCYLYQSFYYGMDNSNSMFLKGFDPDKYVYVSGEPIDKKIKTGTLLKPFWKIKTDENGKLPIPFSMNFFYQPEIYYIFNVEEQSKKVKVVVSDRNDVEVQF
ncbi:MAG: hypothetical protein Q4B14_05050 [Clostridia bacterium]|nr:hypothetical protein [Clostridia bacterium]